MAGLCEGGNELPGSLKASEAPCKADLNNFKGKLFRGRVSIPGLLVESTSALPLSYPGTPPDTVSTVDV
ncbi:hypothetical protein ANN_12722 [Periplaneta americana]|uniref:Uncharacterized protein n=1 Tax=Periplaneta americana TaxID=6978 RepID=A0ABQ8THC7_PERAM|nr:hypothetical protein ANN_12722 [Periplaneta americana]